MSASSTPSPECCATCVATSAAPKSRLARSRPTTRLRSRRRSPTDRPSPPRDRSMKSSGNPLFIVELVRAGLNGGDDEGLPPKVHAVIRTRFSQLSNATRDVASLAAVVGRPFTSDLLAKVSGGDEDAIADAIDELWQRCLIQEQSSGAYDFTHGLLRDVCYSDLGPARRRSIHPR